jgi:uncharacterized protein
MPRQIPFDFDPLQLVEVDRRLCDIAKQENVTIPLAIESGSRAWGFPSPDSDYDVRFIFFRPLDQYANLWPPRDVIEQPIEGDMDVNGWDLSKALKLMLKGNAVIIEWLQSPITYQSDDVFRSNFLALAQETTNRSGLVRHYYHLGIGQLGTSSDTGSPKPVKKLFYTARPALTLRWLRLHPERTIPPMDFACLLLESDPPHEIKARFEELVEKKAVTKELGSAPVHGSLLEFISEEFAKSSQTISVQTFNPPQDAEEKAQAFFFDTISNSIAT